MLYDKIVLTHEDIILLSVLVGQQIKFDIQVLSSKPSRSKSKYVKRLKEQISILSVLLDKLNSIKSVTYDKK